MAEEHMQVQWSRWDRRGSPWWLLHSLIFDEEGRSQPQKGFFVRTCQKLPLCLAAMRLLPSWNRQRWNLPAWPLLAHCTANREAKVTAAASAFQHPTSREVSNGAGPTVGHSDSGDPVISNERHSELFLHAEPRQDQPFSAAELYKNFSVDGT